MAVAYTKERQQFGRVIASFQAIKHKAADMMLKAEAAKSAVYYAACVAQEALTGGPQGAELAEAAKDGCPISRALKGNVELSVVATLA